METKLHIVATLDTSPGMDGAVHIEGEGIDRIHYVEEKTASELVRRWNAHPELVAALQDLTNTANHIESIMDGDKDKQKAWTVELHGIYGAIDRARTLLQSLQSNG